MDGDGTPLPESLPGCGSRTCPGSKQHLRAEVAEKQGQDFTGWRMLLAKPDTHLSLIALAWTEWALCWQCLVGCVVTPGHYLP